MGGAHRDQAESVAAAGRAISTALAPLLTLDPVALRAQRREKFLAMGREGLI